MVGRRPWHPRFQPEPPDISKGPSISDLVRRRAQIILNNAIEVYSWGNMAHHRTEHYASTDRKSTRLNSSHLVISYAVFCLKKKTHRNHHYNRRAGAACCPRPTIDRGMP